MVETAVVGTVNPTRILTHLCLAFHKRDIGKQYRPRSDDPDQTVEESTQHKLVKLAFKQIICNGFNAIVLNHRDTRLL